MLQVLLFFHLLAVVTLFSAMAVELIGFARLHRASTLADVRIATLNFPLVGPMMGLGTLVLIAAGIALIYVGGFGWAPPWVNITFLLTIILAINGPITNGKRCGVIHALATQAGDGPITQEIQAARADRILNYSIYLSAWELVAALFIMTTKPGLAICVTAVLFAAVLAGVATFLVLRRGEQLVPERA